MREVGAREARNILGAFLDLVEQGEEIVITRRGRRIARLVPDVGENRRLKALRAAADILAMSKGVTLGGLRIKDLINEGRREMLPNADKRRTK